MTLNLPTLTQIKDWSHSFAAFLAMAGVALGVVVNVIHAFNSGVPTNYADTIAAMGAGFLALSKAIDSWSFTKISTNSGPPTTVVNNAPPPA